MRLFSKLLFTFFFSAIISTFAGAEEKTNTGQTKNYSTIHGKIFEESKKVGTLQLIARNNQLSQIIVDQGKGQWILQVKVTALKDGLKTSGKVCKTTISVPLYEAKINELKCMKTLNFATTQAFGEEVTLANIDSNLKLNFSVLQGPRTELFKTPLADLSN